MRKIKSKKDTNPKQKQPNALPTGVQSPIASVTTNTNDVLTRQVEETEKNSETSTSTNQKGNLIILLHL
jgi:hypothetical protein